MVLEYTTPILKLKDYSFVCPKCRKTVEIEVPENSILVDATVQHYCGEKTQVEFSEHLRSFPTPEDKLGCIGESTRA